MTGVTTCDPELGSAPDHSPDAVQDWACVELHVNVVGTPAPVVVGFAERVTVAVTVTVYVTGTISSLPLCRCVQELSVQMATCTESE